jgi:hypothetical protein
MTRDSALILSLLFLGGCASRGAGGDGETASPFVETVPGSIVKFTMRPVTTWDVADRPRTVWFAETETTWDAYDVFFLRLDEQPGVQAGGEGPDAITRPSLPYSPPDRGWGHSGYPAIGVTFHAATKYCEWLSERTGRRYRLPTAAEWRDATWELCGSGAEPQPRMDWFADNSGDTTRPVAELSPNHLGLYDIVGNVAEWGIGDDGKPVVLGGSYRTDLETITEDEANAALYYGDPQSRAWNANDPAFPKSKWWLSDAPFVGFRVVCEGPPG